MILDLIVYPALLLALVFPLAIQYTRGGWWRLVTPITVAALILDVALNYTTLALLTWDFPRAREYTFSIRLKRLVKDPGWRGGFALAVAVYLNYYTPGNNHV